MPHEGTPTFYELKLVKGRMPHEGTPTFYELKLVKGRMPHKALAVTCVPARP